MKKVIMFVALLAGLFVFNSCDSGDVIENDEMKTTRATMENSDKCRFYAYPTNPYDIFTSPDFFDDYGTHGEYFRGRMVLLYTNKDLSEGISDVHELGMGDDEDIRVHWGPIECIDYSQEKNDGFLRTGYNGILIYDLDNLPKNSIAYYDMYDSINPFRKIDVSDLDYYVNTLPSRPHWLVVCFFKDVIFREDVRIIIAMKYHGIDNSYTGEGRHTFGTYTHLDSYTERWQKVLYDYRDYK